VYLTPPIGQERIFTKIKVTLYLVYIVIECKGKLTKICKITWDMRKWTYPMTITFIICLCRLSAAVPLMEVWHYTSIIEYCKDFCFNNTKTSAWELQMLPRFIVNIVLHFLSNSKLNNIILFLLYCPTVDVQRVSVESCMLRGIDWMIDGIDWMIDGIDGRFVWT
jgi:hypothetical protein